MLMLAQLPFTSEQFFDVFERYNTDLPFAGSMLAAIAVAVVLLLFVKTTVAARAIYLFLGLLWAWTGIVYHIHYFSAINPAALLFGAMVVVQAGLFAWVAIFTREPHFEAGRGVRSLFGIILIVYALIIYPLIGMIVGHEFPRTPTFGLPCPLTIFTFGMLMVSARGLRWYLLIIPTIWAVIGSSAAMFFGIWQDLALPVAAIISIGFAFLTRPPR